MSWRPLLIYINHIVGSFVCIYACIYPSTFVWDNGLNPTPEVRWRIIGKRRKVQPNGLCGVCNLEKLTILKSGPNTLNKRDEILRKCPHRDKNSLAKCWHLRAPGGECTAQHSHRCNSQHLDPIGSDDPTVELMIVGVSRHETICIRGESFYSFWIMYCIVLYCIVLYCTIL